MPDTQPATKVNNTPFRLCCFTIFDMAFDFTQLHDKVQFYCKGREVCPETQREHWQCFAYISKAQRWSWWKKLIGPHHIERCRGTIFQNEKYCKKEGLWEEWGTKPMHDGLHYGLVGIKHKIEEGATFNEVQDEDEHFVDTIRYERALKNFCTRKVMERATAEGFKKKKVIFYIGKSGVGKSRDVRSNHEPHDVYTMPDNKMHWAGSYSGQPVVLFDDVTPESVMSVTDFLRYTDGYPIEAPVKGGYVPWIPEYIYFTTNYAVGELFPDCKDESFRAVCRRITERREYIRDGSYTVTHATDQTS